DARQVLANDDDPPVKRDRLPAIDAILNGRAAVLLLVAYVCIRQGNIRAHAYLMLSAVIVSAVFLGFYLFYHYHAGEKSTKNLGLPGWLRGIYLAILLPHLLLAMGMLPMIVVTLWRAYQRDWVGHRRISRPTFWIWLYVSVMGV